MFEILLSESNLTETGHPVLVSRRVDQLHDDDPDEPGEDEDDKGDDGHEGRVPDERVAELVVRGQLGHHRPEEGPREEALAARAEPALEKKGNFTSFILLTVR